MATTPNDLPTPVTREEMYLNAIAQNGTGGGGSSTLAGLTDVDISNPSNGQTLVYNSTSGKWENGAGGGGSSEVLVVNAVFDETLGFDGAYKLDSTWQEIYDAATSGKVVFVTDAGVGYVEYRFVAAVLTPDVSGTGHYEVITLTANMQDYQLLSFRCSNATDYPTDA